jgi:hypothetical protein
MRLTMRWTWIAIGLAIGLAPGCERKPDDPGPSCDKVADHVAEVARKAFPGHGDMMPASSRKAYVESCQSRKLSAKQRRCMLEAQSVDAIAECMPKEKGEKKPEIQRGTPAPPAPAPPPAPSGTPAPAPAPSGTPTPPPTPAPSPAPAPAAPAPAAPPPK